MAKPFEQLTIKGDTYARHLQSEQGRGLLRWLTTQPCKDEKFAEWTDKRNAWILEKLEENKDDYSANEKMIPDAPKTPSNPPTNTPSVDFTDIFKVLDRVVSNQEEILRILNKEEVPGTKADSYGAEVGHPAWDE